MNERIKQLIAEAGFITTPNTDVITNNHFGGYMDGNQFEKFARLIVQECANIAYEYDAPKMSGPGMIIAGRIETHFGVEE